MKEFAAANNITPALHDADDLEGLAKTLTTIPQSVPDIFIRLTNLFVINYRKLIVDAANRFRLAAIYTRHEFVDDGGMICYGASTPDAYRQAAEYVDKIFRVVQFRFLLPSILGGLQ